MEDPFQTNRKRTVIYNDVIQMGATFPAGRFPRPNQTQMELEIQLIQSGGVRFTNGGEAWLQADSFEWLEDWA